MCNLRVSYEQNGEVLGRGCQLEREPLWNAVSRIVNDLARPPREVFAVPELVEPISSTRYRVPMGVHLGAATDVSCFPTVLVDRMP